LFVIKIWRIRAVSNWQRFFKRGFDICLAVFGIIIFSWLILICWLISSIDTRQNGFYIQPRVGREGKVFLIIKIRTMRSVNGITSVFTMRGDPRVTQIGAVMRKFKLDELPQLINVLTGQMSFVGPRPDVVGFADCLQGEDRIILSVRPGITGPATLIFRNEEVLLSDSDDPERFNREVLYPAKVKINRQYIKEYRFFKDVLYILATLIPALRKRVMHDVEMVPELLI